MLIWIYKLGKNVIKKCIELWWIMIKIVNKNGRLEKIGEYWLFTIRGCSRTASDGWPIGGEKGKALDSIGKSQGWATGQLRGEGEDPLDLICQGVKPLNPIGELRGQVVQKSYKSEVPSGIEHSCLERSPPSSLQSLWNQLLGKTITHFWGVDLCLQHTSQQVRLVIPRGGEGMVYRKKGKH